MLFVQVCGEVFFILNKYQLVNYGQKVTFVGRIRLRVPAFTLRISLRQIHRSSSRLILFIHKDARMKRLFLSLFSSPESLLQVMSQQEIIEAVEDGDRIIIDQDGNASVNYKSNEVRQDFLRHVNMLKRA